jgi:hypothetical protein
MVAMATLPYDNFYTSDDEVFAPQPTYSVETVRSFTLPALSETGGSLPESDSPACDDLRKSAQAIWDSTDEAALAAVLTEARAQLELADPLCRGEIRLLRNTIADTYEVLGTYRMEEGDVLTVKVSRTESEKTCEATISTEPSGRWLTSYGFTFVPNNNDEYFTRSLGEGKFEIVERNNDRSTLEDLDFVPSFFYTYLPRRQQGRDVSWGPSFGLGFDQSSPAVFVGYGGDYRRFVNFMAGIVIHEQQKLDGRYSAGQELTMELNEDDLHDESYGLNFFIGVSFRFNGNPFTRGDGGDDKQPQEVPTPQEGEGDEQPAQPEDAG